MLGKTPTLTLIRVFIDKRSLSQHAHFEPMAALEVAVQSVNCSLALPMMRRRNIAAWLAPMPKTSVRRGT